MQRPFLAALLLIPVCAFAAPTITDVTVTPRSATAVQITWTTDEPSTSQVLFTSDYNTGCQPYRRYPEPADQSMTTRHTVDVANLMPGSTFFYYVISVDRAGDVAKTLAKPPVCAPKYVMPPVDPSTPFDYRVNLIGPKHVFAGSDLYIGYNQAVLGGKGTGWYYPLHAVSGVPASVTSHVICVYNAALANENADLRIVNGEAACGNIGSYRFHIGNDVPPGKYTLAIDVWYSGVEKMLSYPFEVLAAPNATPRTPAPIPLPDLSKWETMMTQLGHKWCDWANANAFAYGVTQQIWYYDGGRTMMQVGDYTKDPSWQACADLIVSRYRDEYVLLNKGKMPGYKKFADGMAMHYLRFHDDASRQGVLALLASVEDPYFNAAAPVRGGLTRPGNIRELAYAIDIMVAAERIGQPRSTYLPRAVDGAIAMFDNAFVSNIWQANQPFFGGLMSEALIAYYQQTKDPRVIPTIKEFLDWVWNHGTDQQTGKLIYNPLLVPPTYVANLNNLVAPAFAWYWAVTGDAEYARRGDFIFAHSFDDDVTFTGKEYNENYRWSFDYVKWRQHPETASQPDYGTATP